MRALSERRPGCKTLKSLEVKVDSLLELRELLQDDYKRLIISLIDLETLVEITPEHDGAKNLEDVTASLRTHVLWINSLLRNASEISARLKQGSRLQDGEMA